MKVVIKKHTFPRKRDEFCVAVVEDSYDETAQFPTGTIIFCASTYQPDKDRAEFFQEVFEHYLKNVIDAEKRIRAVAY